MNSPHHPRHPSMEIAAVGRPIPPLNCALAMKRCRGVRRLEGQSYLLPCDLGLLAVLFRQHKLPGTCV